MEREDRRRMIPENMGIDEGALKRYVEEQIYTLPGIDNHRELLTVLVTGSRATEVYKPDSDYDMEVLCPRRVWEKLHRAAREKGIVKAEKSFFLVYPEEGWEKYFGEEKGRPHFSVISLDHVELHFRDYIDPWLWIWLNAKAVVDPGGQFETIRGSFQGYPPDVLVRKIKYRWLLCAYWLIEAFPLHHEKRPEALLAAAGGVINAANEYLRLFFLLDGRPFPYTPKLVDFAALTTMGKRYLGHIQRAAGLAVGRLDPEKDPWERIEAAADLLLEAGEPNEAMKLENACMKAMVKAGVDPDWVNADFKNIDELLLGELGPAPV
jgi:predicted nucleotidyltransferase